MANSISGNAGIAGALVVLTGTSSATTFADGSGNYTFSGLAAGAYQVLCQKYRYSFAPWVSQQTIVSSNITGVNFVASAQGVLTQVWEKQGTVLSPATNQASVGVLEPSVIYEGNAQILSGNVFKMWFTGGNADGIAPGVYYAESSDGISWTQLSSTVPVISSHVSARTTKIAGTYYNYGVKSVGGDFGTQIDRYTSPDGVNWTLANSNVLSVGGAGSWDSNQIYNPTINIIGGIWYMLYGADGGAGTMLAMGLATSPDGITWTKYASNPVLWNFSSQNIILINGVYYAWGDVTVFGLGGPNPTFFPTDFSRTQSVDLINWSAPTPSIPRTLSSEVVGGHANNSQLDSPAIVQVGEKSYMWYDAVPSNASGGTGFNINLATTNQPLTSVLGFNDGGGLMVPLASDNFQRANENPLSGGGVWTSAVLNGMQIVSDLAETTVASATNGSAYTGITWPNDQYSEVTCAPGFVAAGANYYVIPMVRIGGTLSSPTCYLVFVSGTGAVILEKYVSGTLTNLSGSATPAFPTVTVHDGDVFSLKVIGTTLSVWQNGQLVCTCTDSAIASGSAGFGAFATTILADAQISLWAGGATGYAVTGNVGVAGATVSWSGPTSGSVVSDALGNFDTNDMLTNGSYTITASLPNYTFSPASSSQTVNGSDISGVNFTATKVFTVYSVPDARNYGNFPNLSTNVNGTLTYTVPKVYSLKYWFDVLFNRTQPLPEDCRAAGAPVASGTYPQNSRAPGTYGPGE